MDIFRPDKFRYFSWYVLCFAIGQFFITIPIIIVLRSLSILNLDFSTMVITALSVAIGWAIGTSIKTANEVVGIQIVIADGAIAGPSLWSNRRVQISLNDLDKEKSCRQNFFQRILGYRLIQSKTSQKIMFAERVFDKNQVTEILKKIGCADSLAA